MKSGMWKKTASGKVSTAETCKFRVIYYNCLFAVMFLLVMLLKILWEKKNRSRGSLSVGQCLVRCYIHAVLFLFFLFFCSVRLIKNRCLSYMNNRWQLNSTADQSNGTDICWCIKCSVWSATQRTVTSLLK